MSKRMMKKAVCGVLAVSCIAACAGTMTACETSRPEVEIQLEFNGETYTLDYTLYRKIAPSTVEHFLWLAGNGYYDGMCVHNYETGSYERMHTGGYLYSSEKEEDGGLTYVDYYNKIAQYDNFANFPVSVWQDKEKEKPLYTLRGEFSDAKFTVENGALKESFGSLTMYYHAKNTKATVYVPYAKADKAGELARREYKYNSATSLFYISLYQGEISNKGYCTFATLKENSVETLEQFEVDLNDFIQEEYGTEDETATASDFTTSQSVHVDTDDKLVGEQEVTFSIPNQPIVIKKVTVKKY